MRFLLLSVLAACAGASSNYNGALRPQVHFSPPENWMNDPIVFMDKEGIYHLYYQC